ncbi:MAG TPA: WecB/TagA/CpsF family glycosyltransferase [Chitinophagaceae bacterium]|nr:WecB/TagA/CpsF family glycosyltransferase [Chitinophagaceae bacterium]
MSKKFKIVSLSVNYLSFEESLNKVIQLGLSHEPSFICFANVHMATEAYLDNSFLQRVDRATLVLADGKPIAAAFRWIYNKKQERIAGMDFMPRLLRVADTVRAKIFLFGSTNEVLDRLKLKINLDYPNVVIVGVLSPPFRILSPDEQISYIDQINQHNPHFVMVSLGCPKQEKWMADNYKKINAVLLGVGGAFPVMAGIQKRSPKWMQHAGLEWCYRLVQEPIRLFKRYLTTNSLFIYLLIRQWISTKLKIR